MGKSCGHQHNSTWSRVKTMALHILRKWMSASCISVTLRCSH